MNNRKIWESVHLLRSGVSAKVVHVSNYQDGHCSENTFDSEVHVSVSLFLVFYLCTARTILSAPPRKFSCARRTKFCRFDVWKRYSLASLDGITLWVPHSPSRRPIKGFVMANLSSALQTYILRALATNSWWGRLFNRAARAVISGLECELFFSCVSSWPLAVPQLLRHMFYSFTYFLFQHGNLSSTLFIVRSRRSRFCVVPKVELFSR